LSCNSNLMLSSTASSTSNKRSYTDCEEDDADEFSNLTLTRIENKEEVDYSYMQNSIITTQLYSSIESDDIFSLLDNAIRQGQIDVALELIEETNSFLEQENNQGETPLLLAAKLNQNILIKIILEKRPELVRQIDQQGNNLLHLLASVSGDKAKMTIENILMGLDSKTREYLITKLNNDKQTPKQVAKNYGNIQCIDLLK
jgi:ankyrin repeat protein